MRAAAPGQTIQAVQQQQQPVAVAMQGVSTASSVPAVDRITTLPGQDIG